jgi:hypothetical protein
MRVGIMAILASMVLRCTVLFLCRASLLVLGACLFQIGIGLCVSAVGLVLYSKALFFRSASLLLEETGLFLPKEGLHLWPATLVLLESRLLFLWVILSCLQTRFLARLSNLFIVHIAKFVCLYCHCKGDAMLLRVGQGVDGGFFKGMLATATLKKIQRMLYNIKIRLTGWWSPS